MKTCFLILFLFFFTFSIGGNSARLYAGEPDSQGTPPRGTTVMPCLQRRPLIP